MPSGSASLANELRHQVCAYRLLVHERVSELWVCSELWKETPERSFSWKVYQSYLPVYNLLAEFSTVEKLQSFSVQIAQQKERRRVLPA
jgi:hypothetical protein